MYYTKIRQGNVTCEDSEFTSVLTLNCDLFCEYNYKLVQI